MSTAEWTENSREFGDISRHSGALYALGCRILGGPAAAETWLKRTVPKIFGPGAEGKPVGSRAHWLAVYRNALDDLHRAVREVSPGQKYSAADDTGYDWPIHAEGLTAPTFRNLRTSDIRRALRALPIRNAIAFSLCDLAGMDEDFLADVLQVGSLHAHRLHREGRLAMCMALAAQHNHKRGTQPRPSSPSHTARVPDFSSLN